jgi:hypothetical protein
MPLNVAPKTNANNPASQPAARPSVQVNPRSQSTARAEALKERLKQGPPPSQTIAPRAAGSSARAEQFSKLQKYPIPPPQAAAPTAAPAPTAQPMGDVEPPPSGAIHADPTAETMGAEAPDASAPAAALAPAPSTDAARVAGTPAPVEASSEPVSTQFAVLARKERQVRKAQQDLQAARDAWKQEQAQYIKRDQLTGPDALNTLAELGLTNDRLVELQLSQANPDPNADLLTKIASLEARLAKVDETFKERDDIQVQQALRQIKSDVQLLVNSDPAFEMIAATESVDEVVDLIKKVFDAEGVVLSVEDAASQVEEKLVEREYDRVQRLTQLQKIKSRLAPKPQDASPQGVAAAAATPPPQQPAQPTATTLTNSGARTRPMSPRDRAVARLKGDL